VFVNVYDDLYQKEEQREVEMEESAYKDIYDREKVLFKGKVEVHPRSKNAETCDCCVTGASVAIESTEPLQIPMDKIEDRYLGVAPIDSVELARRQLVSVTVALRYRDASERSKTAQFTMSAFEAGMFTTALEKAQKAPERTRLRLLWRDVWSREFTYQTPLTVKPTKTFTRIFNPIDKTRDKLCTDLCAIGLDARMVVPPQTQEEVIGHWLGRSPALIEIRHNPIRLVNVLKHEDSDQYGGHLVSYSAVYFVPDLTIPWDVYGPDVLWHGRSVRVKSVPIFGRVVNIRWEGNFERDIIMRLGQDVSLSQSLIRLKEDVEIISYPAYGCWTISPPSNPDQLTAPSREQWDCYETIARHLLESTENE